MHNYQSKYATFSTTSRFLGSRLSTRLLPLTGIFLLIATVAYLHHLSFFTPLDSTEITNASNPPPPHQTPVLIAQAREKWNTKLKRQSRTVEQAAREYRRRYGIDPPHGFDVWFEYAESQDVVLVDEYDEMMAAVLPFLEMGSTEAKRRAGLLRKERQRANRILVGGKREDNEDYIRPAPGEEEDRLRTDKLVEMLKPVMGLLERLNWPEWSVMVSEIPEPRVLNSFGDVLEGETIWELSMPGDRRLVESIKKTCGPDSRFAKKVDNYTFEYGLEELYKGWAEWDEYKREAQGKEAWPDDAPLVDVERDMDICASPELITSHGLFRTNWNTTKLLVPLLSYGRPSAYGDIPIPSSFQWDYLENYLYDPSADRTWEEKEDVIYWHGEPSGGGKGDEFFGSMHRHRLVALSNPPPSPWNHPSNLYAYTNITFSDLSPAHCVLFSCNHLTDFLPFTPRTPFSDSWRNKIVLDLDGWGPSGRWRGLISSNSLPVRSTIYHEWFTDRMVPWWHYVPLSVGVTRDGLGGVVKAFLGSDEGRYWGSVIAEEGKAWAEGGMRRVDMTVYVFRLVLELNRVFNGGQWRYEIPE
ncbi:hypothetical protein BJ508DRAFT_224827 [Ascobolus immersus RN42]|uniref:Glycosyl transferase CAP10 domain-containing protein n=1 Tax=Ascobolus immersus RN42 TaxID=1160509 RepID=A0A3N4I8P1_ASCIM|nr:hypothetical protein BJ508DRAFT_224827 [Ascobolus immersus RN42]